MENDKYTWEQVTAYAIIALHKIVKSKMLSLKNMKKVLQEVKTQYGKEGVALLSELLIKDEK